MPDSSLLRSIACGIGDAALAPAAWKTVLGQLTEYLGAIGAAYILTNRRTGQVEWITLAGPSVELQSEYVAHFAAADALRAITLVLVALALIPIYGAVGAIVARLAARVAGAGLVLAALWIGRPALQVQHEEAPGVFQ